MKKNLVLLFILFLIPAEFSFAKTGKEFTLASGKPIHLAVDQSEKKVVHIAVELFSRDCEAVLSSPVILNMKKSSNIIVGTVGKSSLLASTRINTSELYGKKDAFLIEVTPNGKLVIAGSNERGTAYGLLEVSHMMGVSPWEWWADAIPDMIENFNLPPSFRTFQSPSVEYRGIFLNDEDWALLPWSNKTYEPNINKNHIGPKTYSRIFELLLRLRANTLWPAMHECTLPFFLTEGNRQAAEDYSIFIGSSHCEPMICSVAGEWQLRGKGDYDYVNNSENVYQFWEDRVKEVAGQDNIYTLGMRGVHDGKMQGATTIAEQKNVIVRVMEDQRGMLKKYVDENISNVPQVFIPYKEVLDIYNDELEVPDDVTLMWCDDNYGYIRHFPTEEERKRTGGNGIYYHISYWGRPHDYLWLSTISPGLIFQQMSMAYEQGIQKMWIVNVGDIKPAEYQTELFLNMAWDYEGVKKKGISAHQYDFLEREFGKETAEKLLPVMVEHYRLAHIRKPEFMGNTREEEWNNPSFRVITDLPWTEEYIINRLADYKRISDEVEAIARDIPATKQDAFFQLVKYPVQGATQINNKLLYAQLARHDKADWTQSNTAYDSIISLTKIYNEGICNKGKWNYMMDYEPRNLPVFSRVTSENSVKRPWVQNKKPLYSWGGSDYIQGNAVLYTELGYEGKAVGIPQGESLSFQFGEWNTDSVEIEVRLLPTHPVKGDKLRFELSLDDNNPQIISYETVGRSEEWKQNILRNQAIRRVTLPISSIDRHTLKIKAIDEGVILDQVMIYPSWQ